jgi:hypothetical protein
LLSGFVFPLYNFIGLDTKRFTEDFSHVSYPGRILGPRVVQEEIAAGGRGDDLFCLAFPQDGFGLLEAAVGAGDLMDGQAIDFGQELLRCRQVDIEAGEVTMIFVATLVKVESPREFSPFEVAGDKIQDENVNHAVKGITGISRLLPAGFSAIHARFKTPYLTTIITGAVSMVIAALFPIGFLGELVSIGALLAFTMVCAGVLVMRYTKPDVVRPFRVPLVRWVPALGVLLSLAQMASLPRDTWIRLVTWMVIGLVIYFSYSHRNSRLYLAEKE